MKDRYYDICRTLLKHRESSNNNNNNSLTTITHPYSFDKARELERKEALEVLYSRTREQMEEEEALLVEVKRIEQEEAKLAREREGVMHVQPIPFTFTSSTNYNINNSNTHAPDSKVRTIFLFFIFYDSYIYIYENV